MDILQQLKHNELLADVPERELQWVIDHGKVLTFEEGDEIFRPGGPIDRLIILLSGQITMKFEQNKQFRIADTLHPGAITGYLPYSRAREATAYGVTSAGTRVLTLDKSCFREMITHNEVLTEALVHVMSSRIRQMTKRMQQDEKIMALGKLSAGLAHELNNPSAAVTRSAQTLGKHLRNLPDKFKSVIKIKMSDQQVDAVNDILFAKLNAGLQQISLMEKSEKEDELMDWLDDFGIADSDELAENFVEYGFDTEDLESIKAHVSDQDIPAVLNWLHQVLTTERLIDEIAGAAQRISDLTSSIKSYTHMDQAPEKRPADIHEGIENTLTMLNHRLAKSHITVVRKFDRSLAHPSILPSEINQVWTNLIDNAIDAMKDAPVKELTLETKQDNGFIEVNVCDTGSGIPEEIVDRIFEPFFTTKGIGEGTGLGLEIVHQIVTARHNGTIKVTSKPGQTIFHVCIPLNT